MCLPTPGPDFPWYTRISSPLFFRGDLGEAFLIKVVFFPADSVCFFSTIIMLVIILEAIQVPTEGIALILGVDRILDMMRTVTNVTGDAAVACVIASSEGALGPPGSDA